MEGVLENAALVDALRALRSERRTGILTVQGEEEIIAFSFLEGGVVSADALNQSLEDGLGEVLVDAGMLGSDDFAGLVAEYQAGGGRVSDLLLERSFMTREQLLDALRTHTYGLCRQALTWKKGEYRFYQGEDVAYEKGIRPLDVDELLVRASIDLGAAGPFGESVPWGDTRYRALIAGDLASAVPGEVRDSERPEAEELYRALDGADSLAEIAERLGLTVFTAQALAAPWLRSGLIEALSEAAEPVPPLAEPGTSPGEVVAGLGLDAIMPGFADDELEAPVAEAHGDVRRPKKRRKTEVSPWPPRAMGVGLLAAMLWVLVAIPGRLLFPFPWHGGLRTVFDAERTLSSVRRIEDASTLFFLLDGRYPEDLSLLVADRLLPQSATRDAHGRPFALTSGPASYLVQIEDEGADLADSVWSYSIGENFLLDPEFLVEDLRSEPPLVLLD